mmetsp:Transcript_15072/g.20182  ORF Transcript_15072/g.20182 Transcript_15072/m.20182 type:complete len:404 (-) Transcript_15072:454-1665(-)
MSAPLGMSAPCSAWTKLGNVLMFDWPPPVGFSYCDGAVDGDGMSCGVWNDTRTMDADYAALRGWFDNLFPEYKSNPLYLTGESYAGVYIPKLAQAVLASNAAAESADPLNMKGFAVGDACAGTEVLCGQSTGEWWSVVFFYGHGQFSNRLFDDIVETCTIPVLKSGVGVTAACEALLDDMWTQIGGFYDYNLYDDCTYENDLRRHRALTGRKAFLPMSSHGRHSGARAAGAPNGGALNDYVCGGGPAQEIWAIHPDVMAALHVSPNSAFFSGDNGDGMEYELTEKNLMPFYQDVALNHPELRVLVYNGDTDPGINSFVAQNWTSALGLEETESWRPWTLDGCQRMGGYVTRYEGNFDFLTVRGSGHMVPTYKPEAAFEAIGRWVADEAWQSYNSSCTQPSSKN